MKNLSEKFKTGRFGETAVRSAEGYDRDQRVFPVFLEEDVIKAIQTVLNIFDGNEEFAEDFNEA